MKTYPSAKLMNAALVAGVLAFPWLGMGQSANDPGKEGQPSSILNYRTLRTRDVAMADPLRKLKKAIQQRGYAENVTVSVGPKTGTAPKTGITYLISKGTPPALPASSVGISRTNSSGDDLMMCKTAPMVISQLFESGLIFVGSPFIQDRSAINPGTLFRDSDVIQGNFAPLTLPRKPGSIVVLDVQNLTGDVAEPVANFNNLSTVANAVNRLRTRLVNATPITDIVSMETVFQAEAQFSLALEAQMGLNVGEIINMPGDFGANYDLGFEANAAVTVFKQLYYAISVGGEGPASTIEGLIPPDAVCVSDVVYGRAAFLVVTSARSRYEASVISSQLVRVGLDGSVDPAKAERSLSTSARLALESGSVFVRIIGGDVSSAVKVRDLASLRKHIEGIKPTLGGVQAVPLYYTLRYAADNQPCKIGAFASFTDKECFRADQLKITLKSIKATKVVDFGDEELFGKISVNGIGTRSSGSRTLWEVSNAKAKQAARDENILPGPSVVRLNINPANTPEQGSVEFWIDIKDKIEAGAESLGASARARTHGYVSYTPRSFSIPLDELKKAPNWAMNRQFHMTEDVADRPGKVCVEVQLELRKN